MVSAQAVQSAWNSYQESVDALLSLGALADAAPASVEARSDVVLERSQHLREVLTVDLESEDLEVREQCALTLLTSASRKLEAANALLEGMEPGTGALRIERRNLLVASDFKGKLVLPFGVGADRPRGDEEGAGLDRRAAREKLEQAITTFLDTVPNQAADMSLTIATSAAFSALLPAVREAVPLAAGDILARLPAGLPSVIRKGAEFIVDVLRDLRAAIGPEVEKAGREKAAKWFEDLKKDRGVLAGLLDRLYETERIGNDTLRVVQAAPDYVEAIQFTNAAQELDRLQDKYRKITTVLGWSLAGLGLLQGKMLASLAAPWGPLALGAAYLAVFGYIVYNGGDYLDWYRTDDAEWLDRVDGLRAVVRQEIRA